MTRRTKTPDDLQDEKEMRNFLDMLDRRKLASVADVDTAASSATLAAKINELLAELRLRGAMES